MEAGLEIFLQLIWKEQWKEGISKIFECIALLLINNVKLSANNLKEKFKLHTM